MTRLLKPDDQIISQRKESGSTYSLLIADLVHKGLAYEALEKGANDPVIRTLLRTLNDLVKYRVEEATKPLLEAVHRNQLFTAALFLAITARLDFPLNADQQQIDEIYRACAIQGNRMVNVILPPLPEELPDNQSDSQQSTIA